MNPSFQDATEEQQIRALSDLARTALAQYEGSFSEPAIVKYRENAIFSVHDGEGKRFALRIHRPHYHSDEALHSELSWMRALAAYGIAVPDVRLNRDGEAITLAGATSVPENRRADLLCWVDGAPLSTLEESGELGLEERRKIYRRLGALTARLHEHGAQWQLPPNFERHDWFTDSLIGENPLWGPFWELPCLTARQRQLLDRARHKASAALKDYPRTPANSGLIHADLIADNLMVSGEAVRPIDFDDCGFGWHMFDIATSLYFLMDDPDFEALVEALFSGYRTVRPLAESEEEALPLFLMLRATTYLGWVGSRSETETARELTPILVKRCNNACERYLEEE